MQRQVVDVQPFVIELHAPFVGTALPPVAYFGHGHGHGHVYGAAAIQGQALVERALDRPSALICDTLGLYWCHRPDTRLGCVLRLAHDPEGEHPLLTPEERVAELEAELRRR